MFQTMFLMMDNTPAILRVIRIAIKNYEIIKNIHWTKAFNT